MNSLSPPPITIVCSGCIGLGTSVSHLARLNFEAEAGYWEERKKKKKAKCIYMLCTLPKFEHTYYFWLKVVITLK